MDLVKIIANPIFLMYCHIKIKNSKASAGIDNVLTYGITSRGYNKLAEELLSGRYTPRPTKRVMIPKADGINMRPLGIAGTKDKVVQNAIRMVLEPIFESIFLDCSHGFRPNRSCHSALKTIQQKWPATT